MVPPSNGETTLPGENGPCFIHVGGVHGLAQKRMLALTACAALTNGMSFCLSRAIEKSASDVSPGRLVERVAIHRVVAGPDRDPAEGEARPVGAVEEANGRIPVAVAEHRQVVPAHLVERAAEALPGLRRGRVVDRHVGVSAGHLGELRVRFPVGARRGRDQRTVLSAAPHSFASGGTQAPLQSTPDAHRHAPPSQTCPVEQGMPQPPQFVGIGEDGDAPLTAGHLQRRDRLGAGRCDAYPRCRRNPRPGAPTKSDEAENRAWPCRALPRLATTSPSPAQAQDRRDESKEQQGPR